MSHFDELETRSADQRAADLARQLPALVARARTLPAYAQALAGIDPQTIASPADLARLPLLRKSDLGTAQQRLPPFGGFSLGMQGFDYAFQSPGPIYEPGRAADWGRIGRFLHAAGIGPGDLVQNCFAYHLTPAGHLFEQGARAVGAAVLPAGPGQTELQVQAAAHLGSTAYAGTPDYLKVILDKAAELGLTLRIARAVVGGGALFPSLRQEYRDRGILCLQSYATAELGNIAYESQALEGMIVDEGVVVEIVRPGTADPVPDGEVGEVVVTVLDPAYPLVRLATGDLSAVLPGISPCGRTNLRIRGWMGRADQTAKVRGLFVRPEQVAAFVRRHPEIRRARLVAGRQGDQDTLAALVEAQGGDPAAYAASLKAVLNLTAEVQLVPPGSLPNDGKVIEDRRSYAT